MKKITLILPFLNPCVAWILEYYPKIQFQIIHPSLITTYKLRYRDVLEGRIGQLVLGTQNELKMTLTIWDKDNYVMILHSANKKDCSINSIDLLIYYQLINKNPLGEMKGHAFSGYILFYLQL